MDKDAKIDMKLYNDYLNGNTKAFELLYLKYKDRIKYFAYNIVKDYEKAEDITQDLAGATIYNQFIKQKDEVNSRGLFDTGDGITTYEVDLMANDMTWNAEPRLYHRLITNMDDYSVYKSRVSQLPDMTESDFNESFLVIVANENGIYYQTRDITRNIKWGENKLAYESYTDLEKVEHDQGITYSLKDKDNPYTEGMLVFLQKYEGTLTRDQYYAWFYANSEDEFYGTKDGGKTFNKIVSLKKAYEIANEEVKKEEYIAKSFGEGFSGELSKDYYEH